MKRTFLQVLLPLLFLFLLSCDHAQSPAGSLFIIGGGSRPPEMVADMVRLSGVHDSGYIVILPMASIEPETSALYATSQFLQQEVPSERIYSLFLESRNPTAEQSELMQNASMIYIPGGSQLRFMDTLEGTSIASLIHEAYQSGAMIAGTSAGAAVQSDLMITGDQVLYPEYTGYFRTIEAGNIIVEKGLGLLPGTIIDQHFIRRQRLNRLISAVMDHPNHLGIGIDESTAIYVHDNSAKVFGESQVITLRSDPDNVKIINGLQGCEHMQLSVFLPGESFTIPH